MTEPNITVHAEATLKSIKKLQLASVGMWFLSMVMYAASDPPSSGLTQASIWVWILSVGMFGTARVKKWWHHS